MKELKKICSEEPNSSFFMCLSTHGARVTRGTNEGSYVLFSETRLSSEEELVLTAIHERDLAQMIHDIPCYRTHSATSTLDQHETIRLAALREGAKGIAKIMEKHKNAGAIHRYAAEILATMAMKGTLTVRGRHPGVQPLEPSDLPVVIAVRNAMLKFKKDMHLQQQGCILFGRLAGVSATWRAALLSRPHSLCYLGA
ncbi:uncharacterized protein IUM83_00808 [Phytophthora cinnamomi]|uniref:uncharacterized protein n=1 Tax=Phytophthora cinnamomi TaxID=4785 RepID=UPI003559A59A|nr:hypothetical protein IUM83_00808 [Phytophthora cinnamomi]